MMNLASLTRSQEIRVLTAQGYALGRLDECHGPAGVAGASDVAQDFGCYVHDVDQSSAIHDAWAAYAAQLAELDPSRRCSLCGGDMLTAPPCIN